MTTDIAQTEEKPAAREPLPPIEVSAAPDALVEEHVAASPAMAVAPSLSPTLAPQPAQPPKQYTGVTGFIIRHPKFTKEPVTYLMYQFARATAATIPYGFGMAAGHHLFGMIGAKGQKMGLTEAGQKLASESGVAAVANIVKKEERTLLYSTAKHAELGRNMMRLGASPLNAAVQIALGFTMFRFTGGIVKNLRDRVMNEKNTPEQTAAEIKNAPKTIWQTMKINWPAESTGTPIAALVLGFMGAAYVPTAVKPLRNLEKSFFAQAKDVVFSKPAKLLQNAAVWTLSYSLFFLTAESLFKDKQIQLGRWKGHPNSLKNGPDDTVGGPGAIRFTPPENDAAKQGAQGIALTGSAEEGYKVPVDDDHAHDSQHKLRYPWLTGEPSIGRFLIRRVAPVAVGITAYAALKRVGYLADFKLPGMKTNYLEDVEKAGVNAVNGIKSSKGWNGPMEPITIEATEKLKTAADHTKFFLKNAYREGKATIMFGALWASTDAWGTWYDKFVHNLQKPKNAVPLNEHQQDKHAELLSRLNAKELGQGRAA